MISVIFGNSFCHDLIKKTPRFHSTTAWKDRYINANAGKSGINTGIDYQYRVRAHDTSIRLVIRRNRVEENQQIFDILYEQKDEIEAIFEDHLAWQAIDDEDARYINYIIPGGGWKDEESWPTIHETMVDAMVRLEEALQPEIDKLR